MLGLVRRSHSFQKLEATFELGGLSDKDFSVLDRAGSIRKGQKEGSPGPHLDVRPSVV